MNLPLKNIQKIGVFRALQLGDMLCVVPALRALRSAYPDAEISLIGLPWAKSFAERFGNYIDRFISFPGYPGLPEQAFDEEKLELFLKKIRKEKFDLLLQMQGNGTIVNDLLSQFGAVNLAGFYNLESQMNSSLFMPYPDHGPEKYRHLSLMRHLGIEPKGSHLDFPLTQKDHRDYEALLLPVMPKGFIIIHPGSRATWRQWPPKYFAAIGDYFIEEGFTVVITGTNNESDITSEVIKSMHHLPIDLTGKTSLGSLGMLVKNAFMIIANCTGISHVADALGTPSVIISMDGEPERWSPENKSLHKVIDWTKDSHFKTVLLESKNLVEDLSMLNT